MESNLANDYTFWQKKSIRFAFVIVLLFILSVPFGNTLLPDVGSWFSPFFENIIYWSGITFFNLENDFPTGILSDSIGMYIHIFNLICLSIIIVFLEHFFNRSKIADEKIFFWLIIVASYFLSFKLFAYGFSKIFKWQFYLPEPNILFTRVGDTPRDLLYWSVMGTSRSYSIFLGVAEILAGALLLSKRTRLLGGLISVGIMANIVAINFCFDISVKIFSTFLLFLSLVLVAKDGQQLYEFFILKKMTSLKSWLPNFYRSKKYLIIKVVIIWIILFETLAKFVSAGNYNDDNAMRPLFHGAYQVEQMIINQDTLQPILTNQNRWKNIFIHRQGFFISQNMGSQMQDYALKYDLDNQQFLLEDFTREQVGYLNFEKIGKLDLHLFGKIKNDSVDVFVKNIDWKQMKLLEGEFKWMLE